MVETNYKHLASPGALTSYANGAKNLKHFKRLKDILEAHQTKTKSLEFQDRINKHQKQMNYFLELERLKGVLEGQAHRLPAISRNQLEDRKAKLIHAIKKKLDDIK